MRNVVITGGTRGIGLSIAQTLVDAGFRAVVIARKAGPAVRDAMLTYPDRWSFIAWDLADIASLSQLAAAVRGDCDAVYGLVNNAAIGTSGILATMPDGQIAQTMQMNVISPITLTKYLIRPMLAAGTGRVVNVTSIVANTGYSGLSAYGASKAAMVGFTRSLAREVGRLGITVNAVAPGFLDTDMTHTLTDKHRQQIARRSALQRMVTAGDVAAMVSFLMSEAAANITGTVIPIDAGNTA
jgi:3-oxoacyl-[acyl-carrier protein] reductase